MKKIVFISDTHSAMHKIIVPECDIVIHSGDATYRGGVTEMKEFVRHFSKIKAKHRIYVAGNHDRGLSKSVPDEIVETIRSMLSGADIVYLEDSSVDIDGLKIFGSPYSPQFGDWGFQYIRGNDRWDVIPEDLDILVTHCPPYGILDKNNHDKPCGCEHLYLHVMKKKPRIHSFGHIHEGYGTASFNDTRFINAACLDKLYDAVNQPIVVEYDEAKRKVHDVYEANQKV